MLRGGMKSWPNLFFPLTHFSFQKRKATDVNLTPTARIYRDLSYMNPKPSIKGTRILLKVLKVIIIIWEITRTVWNLVRLHLFNPTALGGYNTHRQATGLLVCLLACSVRPPHHWLSQAVLNAYEWCAVIGWPWSSRRKGSFEIEFGHRWNLCFCSVMYVGDIPTVCLFSVLFVLFVWLSFFRSWVANTQLNHWTKRWYGVRKVKALGQPWRLL